MPTDGRWLTTYRQRQVGRQRAPKREIPPMFSDPAADFAYVAVVHAHVRDLMARIGKPRTAERAAAIARTLEIESQRLRALAVELRRDKQQPDSPENGEPVMLQKP